MSGCKNRIFFNKYGSKNFILWDTISTRWHQGPWISAIMMDVFFHHLHNSPDISHIWVKSFLLVTFEEEKIVPIFILNLNPLSSTHTFIIQSCMNLKCPREPFSGCIQDFSSGCCYHLDRQWFEKKGSMVWSNWQLYWIIRFKHVWPCFWGPIAKSLVNKANSCQLKIQNMS